MKRYTIDVTQRVVVELDETKLNEEFMEDFRAHFYNFYDLEEHAEHIAQLAARGIIGPYGNQFIEGYGPHKDMGITFKVNEGSTDMDIIEVKDVVPKVS